MLRLTPLKRKFNTNGMRRGNMICVYLSIYLYHNYIYISYTSSVCDYTFMHHGYYSG